MNVICLRLLLSTFNRGEQIHRLFLASVFVEYYLSALHCLQVCSVSLFPAPGVSGRCEEGGGRRGGISARWRSCSEMADYSHCLLRPGETRRISDIRSRLIAVKLPHPDTLNAHVNQITPGTTWHVPDPGTIVYMVVTLTMRVRLSTAECCGVSRTGDQAQLTLMSPSTRHITVLVHRAGPISHQGRSCRTQASIGQLTPGPASGWLEAGLATQLVCTHHLVWTREQPQRLHSSEEQRNNPAIIKTLRDKE